MKGVVLTIGLLALGAVLIAACGQAVTAPAQGTEVKVEGGVYRNIGPAQLSEMLRNKDFPLVNVHIPYAGEIAQTDFFVPYSEIEKSLAEFPADKGAKIVLYCRSGAMSSTAAREMVKLGFTNIWNLDGGMVRWEQEGNRLLRR
ncbi:MAG: rhodanese-like domain-containing protein [Chloroflexi bacterium]|nr:rhodanese-like domain-containing protein [Chloroflexota bacterium]